MEAERVRDTEREIYIERNIQREKYTEREIYRERDIERLIDTQEQERERDR